MNTPTDDSNGRQCNVIILMFHKVGNTNTDSHFSYDMRLEIIHYAVYEDVYNCYISQCDKHQ